MSDKLRLENNNIKISNMINITSELDNKINNLPEVIDTSDATATNNDIMAGKVAYGQNKLIGNVTEAEAWSTTNITLETLYAEGLNTEMRNPDASDINGLIIKGRSNQQDILFRKNSYMDIYTNLDPILSTLGIYIANNTTELYNNIPIYTNAVGIVKEEKTRQIEVITRYTSEINNNTGIITLYVPENNSEYYITDEPNYVLDLYDLLDGKLYSYNIMGVVGGDQNNKVQLGSINIDRGNAHINIQYNDVNFGITYYLNFNMSEFILTIRPSIYNPQGLEIEDNKLNILNILSSYNISEIYIEDPYHIRSFNNLFGEFLKVYIKDTITVSDYNSLYKSIENISNIYGVSWEPIASNTFNAITCNNFNILNLITNIPEGTIGTVIGEPILNITNLYEDYVIQAPYNIYTPINLTTNTTISNILLSGEIYHFDFKIRRTSQMDIYDLAVGLNEGIAFRDSTNHEYYKWLYEDLDNPTSLTIALPEADLDPQEAIMYRGINYYIFLQGEPSVDVEINYTPNYFSIANWTNFSYLQNFVNNMFINIEYISNGAMNIYKYSSNNWNQLL